MFSVIVGQSGAACCTAFLRAFVLARSRLLTQSVGNAVKSSAKKGRNRGHLPREMPCSPCSPCLPYGPARPCGLRSFGALMNTLPDDQISTTIHHCLPTTSASRSRPLDPPPPLPAHPLSFGWVRPCAASPSPTPSRTHTHKLAPLVHFSPIRWSTSVRVVPSSLELRSRGGAPAHWRGLGQGLGPALPRRARLAGAAEGAAVTQRPASLHDVDGVGSGGTVAEVGPGSAHSHLHFKVRDNARKEEKEEGLLAWNCKFEN